MKNRIISLTVIALLLLTTLFLLNQHILYYIETFERHIGRLPHITGEIEIKIDNKNYHISNGDAELTYQDKKLKIFNGKFLSLFGEEGNNNFTLDMYPQFAMRHINEYINRILKIQFSYDIPDEWHKEHIILYLNFQNIEGRLNDMTILTMTMHIKGDKGGKKEEVYLLQHPMNFDEVFTIHIDLNQDLQSITEP